MEGHFIEVFWSGISDEYSTKIAHHSFVAIKSAFVARKSSVWSYFKLFAGDIANIITTVTNDS